MTNHLDLLDSGLTSRSSDAQTEVTSSNRPIPLFYGLLGIFFRIYLGIWALEII